MFTSVFYIVNFSVCLNSNKFYWIEDQLADVSSLFYTSVSWRRRVGVGEANFPFVNGRCHLKRSMPFLRTVVAIWFQEMATYITKEGRVYLAQRGRSAICRRWKGHPLPSSADKTHLVSLGGRPKTGAIPVFHRWQKWLQPMCMLITGIPVVAQS